MEGAIRYEGYGGDIAIEGETLLLTKKGAAAKMIGASGTRRIPFGALTDVQFKDATRLLNGWIQLAIGGEPTKRAEASDPNTVLFRHKSQGQFEHLRDYLLKVVAKNRELGVDTSTVVYDPARQTHFEAAQQRQAPRAARQFGTSESAVADCSDVGGTRAAATPRDTRHTDSRSSRTRKYDPLRDYLAARAGDLVRMTFSEVSDLVGELPPSAHVHRAWWANDSKVQAMAWRSAGWRVASVDQGAEHVVFARAAADGVGSDIAAPPRVERNLSRPSLESARRPSSATSSREGAVFVSYSRDDRDYVGRLAAHLEGVGIDVWYDHRIVPGEQWENVIRRQIEECGVFMVVMTPSAHESRWVRREINYAEELGKEILPLLLTGTPFFRLSDLHYEPVTGGRMPSSQLVERLRILISHPSQP